MPIDNSALAKAFQDFGGQFEQFENVHYAVYVSDNGDGTHVVDVLNPDGSQGPRRNVYGRVKAWAGVILRIGVDRMRWGPTEYIILGVDETGYTYSGVPAPSMLELHGPTHGDYGSDQIPNLHTLQIWMLRVQPGGGLTVDVLEGLYFADNVYNYLPATVNIDLTASVPGVANRGRYATLSIDGAGTITTTNGTVQITPQASDIALPPIGDRPLCAVLLTNGMTTITQTDVRADLRYLAGGVNAGGGGGTIWENVVIVAKGGGDTTTVQGGENMAVADDAVVVMPGDYAENVTWDVDGPLYGAFSAEVGVNSLITGSDDVGPMLDWNVGRVVKGIFFNRTLAGGAGEYTALDMAEAGFSPNLSYSHINISDGATGRDLTGVLLSITADSHIIQTRIYLSGAGTNVAIKCSGGELILEDCIIEGDIVLTGSADLILKNCYITGDVTGIAGSDLYIFGGDINGTVATWDNVYGYYWDEAGTQLQVEGNLNFPTAIAANPGLIEVNNTRFLHTYGTGNMFLGDGAANFTLTGTFNIAVGSLTLPVLTTGIGNAALGYQALKANTTGNYNLAIGLNALLNNISGSYNIGFGFTALSTNTTGDKNTAIGYQSLLSNTSGQQNVGIGLAALYNNTTGRYNVGIGVNPLYNNTEGWYNIAIGNAALINNITALYNIAIGTSALQTNTTGQYNVAIGTSALFANLTASNNVAIGNTALRENTSASNVAVGSLALRWQTAALRNTAIGAFAGTFNVTGDDNVSIGYQAGFGVTGNSNSNNVFIGKSAGSGITTGSNNVCVGYQAGNVLTTGANNIIIGYDVDPTGAAASNELNIGGVIFGTLNANSNITINAATISANYDLMLAGDGVLGLKETTTPAADANYGKVYTKNDDNLYFQDGAGVEHVIGGAAAVGFKSYTVTTQGLGGGATIYAAGFYESSAADANLNQGAPAVAFGSANISYAAHAFVVAGGAGVTDGSDLILTVSGTSIDDSGTRVGADSEVIVADCTAAALDDYYETTKKWLGQITFTLTSTAGTVFSFDFNYGMAKYEDFGNRDFTITDFEAIGYAGANEADLDIELLYHSTAGWTYNAAAFVPGPAALVRLSTDHTTDDQLANGDHFAYKRAGLSTAVTGSGSEGTLARVTTTANNAIEYLNLHIGVKF